MRRHGWSGNVPGSDEEAINRILDAAANLLSRPGVTLKIADIARELGVTRATVYRYFTNADAVLLGCAVRSADGLLDQLITHVGGETDPVKAVIEATVFAVESMGGNSQVGMAYVASPSDSATQEVASHTARAFAQSMLYKLDVDWVAHGYGERDVIELADFCLRALHSLLANPGHIPCAGDGLRRYLLRWMGPVIEYPRLAQAMTQLSHLETIKALRES